MSIEKYGEDCPLPLPNSQLKFIDNGFSQKIKQALKFTPRVLVSLTTNRIKSDKNLSAFRRKRTLSQSFSVTKKISHVRSRSTIIGHDKGIISKKMCKVCMVKQSGAVLIDCQHEEICYQCAEGIFNGSKKCHVCEAEIQGFKKN